MNISAGRVCRLPPRHQPPLSDGKSHFHLLLTDCAERQRGTLAYGTSSLAERAKGASCASVPARSSGVSANGLRHTTHFYPGILYRERHEVLARTRVGHEAQGLGTLRRLFPAALGVGTGTCVLRGAPAYGSWRGRIVRLHPRSATAFRSDAAVILTEPKYSLRRAFQLLLPILPGDGATVSGPVLTIKEREWVRALGAEVTTALLPLPALHSVIHGESITGATEHVIDLETTGILEEALCVLLGA